MKLYELVLKDETLQGVDCISVVGSPAMESTFVALKKEVKLDSYNDYPKEATENAKIALRYAEENGWGDCGTDVGKARANQLANGEAISEETIARMASFARHKQNSDKELGDGCGRLMWLAWGGDAGIEWASRKLDQIRQGKKQDFAKVDNEKQILMGVAMIPDKKIYRFDEQTQEGYYVYFSKDTVRKVSELYLKKANQFNANLEHDPNQKINATVVESWIVEDSEKDKSVLFGLDAPVGSWVVSMKIDDKAQWETAKENGTGFSIEGVFSEVVNLKSQIEMSKNTKIDNLVVALKALFSSDEPIVETPQAQEEVQLEEVQFSEMALKDGNKIAFEGESLTVGGAVQLVTENGNVPLPVGEYELEDGTMLEITEDGVVGELKAPEEMPTEESPQEMNTELSEVKNLLTELKKENESLKAELKTVNEKFAEVSKAPAVEKIVTAPVQMEAQTAQTKRGRLTLALQNLEKK